MKDLNDYTVADFMNVRDIAWNEQVTGFDSLVILPTEELHDSDYRCMYFIACKGNEPIVKIGGGSDVIHLNGIGGYGYNWLNRVGSIPQNIPPVDWSIDCLKGSGLLRLFSHSKVFISGRALSSFDIYAVDKEDISNNQNTN